MKRALVLIGLLAGLGCNSRTWSLTDYGDGGLSGGGANAGYRTDAFGFPTAGSNGGGGAGGEAIGDASRPDRPRTDACASNQEACNGVDDDCDGITDEGFDLVNDPGNCGRCGLVCTFEHAASQCVAGVCSVKDCLPGYVNADGRGDNGCECLSTNGDVELCDGSDNDCDGQVDEDFDFQNSKAHCGGCGNICDFANAASSCNAGVCTMGACVAGRIDLNQLPQDGCEYECSVSNGAIEICDGKDNDCDGVIDDAPGDAGAACGPVVANVGECTRGRITCVSGQLICLGAKQAEVEFCDNRDNNCDGATDEGFDKLSDIRFCGNCQPCALPSAVPRCNVGTCEVDVCSPGHVNLDQTSGNGCEYACTFRGMDVCNGQDDDCDGMTDEGIDKASDPSNCGGCGTVCRYSHAGALCVAGGCAMGPCEPNFKDLDGNPTNGCESFCVASGQEVCDGVDNDCDGAIDEGIDKTSDPANCGMCGRVCQFSNAAATCAAGQCVLAACMPGYQNSNGAPTDGCEYACTPSAGGVEACDGKDNDCDTQIDETDPLLGTSCFPTGATGCDVATNACAGRCGLGKWSCLGGALACQNATLPAPETCDDQDNDCDGTADEDFDKTSDSRFCGACGTSCTFANAVAVCTAATCQIGACKTGFVDLDGNSVTGCEYACTKDGPEICDGRDNDCDGTTDAADGDLLYPTTNFCLQLGECGKGPGGSTQHPGAATFPVCTVAAGATSPEWICNYPATVETSGPNQIQGQESWCDGKDNDCDGAIDEHVAGLGAACTVTGTGQCVRTGVTACDPASRTAPTICDVTNAPAITVGNEVCDGRDNDCDGLTDESWDNPPGLGLPTCAGGICLGVRDSIAHVTGAPVPYYIHAHEASRPDATGVTQGALSTRACSRAGVLPWTSLTYAQAQAACSAAGMRLCRTNRTDCSTMGLTSDEWGGACQTGRSCTSGTFPYGCSYQAQSCNGKDRGVSATVASGSLAACTTSDLDATTAGTQGSFDMSGNVAEWTHDCRGTLSDGSSRRIFTLRGGAHDAEVFGTTTALRCDFLGVQVAENYTHPTAGFRCCSSCGPGQADCNGGCVNLATSAAHCGGCGVACAGGKTCVNGSCQ